VLVSMSGMGKRDALSETRVRLVGSRVAPSEKHSRARTLLTVMLRNRFAWGNSRS
jgi:hypothetical protein